MTYRAYPVDDELGRDVHDYSGMKGRYFVSETPSNGDGDGFIGNCRHTYWHINDCVSEWVGWWLSLSVFCFKERVHECRQYMNYMNEYHFPHNYNLV